MLEQSARKDGIANFDNCSTLLLVFCGLGVLKSEEKNTHLWIVLAFFIGILLAP